MWKIVVPVKPFLAAIDFVSIGRNNPRFEIQFLPDTQPEPFREKNLALRRYL
jgi:hypothetical protein